MTCLRRYLLQGRNLKSHTSKTKNKIMNTSNTVSNINAPACLDSLSVSNFGNPVTDKGSRAHDDVTFWSPISPDGYFALSLAAVGNYNPSPGTTQLVYQPENDNPDYPLLTAPTGFPVIWTCVGNDQPSNLGIYAITAPDGYIGIGSIVNPDFNIPVAPPANLMCVRQDLCELVTLTSENLIWTDQGSGAPLDVSVWSLPSGSGCVATVGNGYPQSVSVWDLKQTI